MNVIDMGLDDELIEEAYTQGLITDWERNFCLGLINFAELSPKQRTKAQLVLKKIERGAKRLASAQQTTAADETGNFCSQCGHPLAT